MKVATSCDVTAILDWVAAAYDSVVVSECQKMIEQGFSDSKGAPFDVDPQAMVGKAFYLRHREATDMAAKGRDDCFDSDLSPETAEAFNLF